MDFAGTMVLHSPLYYRRIQEHYSLHCLNKGCFPAHLSSTLLKQLDPITVTSTISPFSQFFCTCICFSLFLSARWRQCKINFAFCKPGISSVKRFRFIQISCHLCNSSCLLYLCSFVTKTGLREFIKQENSGAGSSKDYFPLYKFYFFDPE